MKLLRNSIAMTNKNEKIGSPYLNPLAALKGAVGSPFIMMDYLTVQTNSIIYFTNFLGKHKAPITYFKYIHSTKS